MKFIFFILTSFLFANQLSLEIGEEGEFVLEDLENGTYECIISIDNFTVFYPLEFYNGSDFFTVELVSTANYSSTISVINNQISFFGLALAGNSDSANISIELINSEKNIFYDLRVNIENLNPRESYVRFSKIDRIFPSLVSPNQEFTLEYINDYTTTLEVNIYDLNGYKFDSYVFPDSPPGVSKLILNSNKLVTNGFYYIVVTDDYGSHLTKVRVLN